MKPILTITILVATALVAQANDKSITENARDTADAVVEKAKEVSRDTKVVVMDAARQAGRATSAAWSKTKAYVSEEMPVYHEGATATLADLANEIAEVKAQTPSAAPAYFRTRVLALDEQHKTLGKLLGSLSPEQLKDHSSGPRHDFDQCIGDLEHAIDQAKEGAGTLSKSTVR